MKIIQALTAMALLCIVISCAEKSPAPRTNTKSIASTPSATAYTPPVPPKDAQWTLHCLSLTMPAHVHQANLLKEQMLQISGLRDWYVIHTNTESSLYYGYYHSISDPNDADSKRAKADRQQISQIKDPAGEFPFRACLFIPIDAGDPAAPPEWNILNKDRDKADDDPARAYWTVEIAVYKDSPLRKEKAVEMVRDARAMGVEAYFYHGPVSSSVTIGAWPRNALKRQEQAGAHTEAVNPDQDVMVVGDQVAPELRDKVRASMKHAKVMQETPQIVDPTLIDVLRKYPEHYLNGDRQFYKVKNPKTGEVEREPVDSFVAEIPRGQANPVSQSGTFIQSSPTPQQPISTPLPPPARPAQSGTGGLRSLDDQ